MLLAGSLTRAAFSQPATWIVLAGWPLSAVVMSLPARRASRVFALLGTVLGGAVLYGTQVLAGQAAHDWGNGAVWSGTPFLVSLVASLILVGFVAALGAPLRAEEEGVAGEYDHYSEDDEAWEEAET
jgi:predicted phage tail protein